MSKGAVNMNESNVEYYTPAKIVHKFGQFDYDPATTPDKARDLGIPYYDTILSDGLLSDWTKYKRIWINPPFNIKHKFFHKAVATYRAAKNEIYFLCPIEFLTTKRFCDCLRGGGVGIKLFVPNGRVKFESGVGLNERSPAFGSVILKIQDYNELEFIDID